MEDQFPSGQQTKVRAFGQKHRTGLVTLLFTDTVGSTALKQQIGDRAAADLFRQHDELIRQTLEQFPEAEEIETAGDSFFLIFATPSQAVKFALAIQTRLRALTPGSGVSAFDRIGIHVGEVVFRDRRGASDRDLFGIQIDTCARVMSLAGGGQILMTRSVFDSARQVLKGEDIDGVKPLQWLSHGPYLLKGLEEPVEICEVCELGQTATAPPTSSDKAQRQVRAGEEPVLGWRPGLGQAVPGTRWILEKKLGEGGFGEVWLGRNAATKEPRVFKFCFQAERVRFLKRELTLFRLLKERVGDHPNIVRLHDVYLDQPPFYVEMDYVEGADLRTWCEQRGGIKAVGLETRLEIVARAAEGLQAAHDAGIIHRDIKPGNILVSQLATRNPDASQGQLADARSQAAKDSPPLVKLTDFGIGQVASDEVLHGITRAGFTETVGADSSSKTGTHLYMAPELVAGKPASARSDIYSLGVVLFQLLAGDFSRPVTMDWWKDISDPLLRDDLQHCFAGDPQERFESARDLARNLRALPLRRTALVEQQAELAARERSAYRRGVMRAASVAGMIVATMAVLAGMAIRQTRLAREREEEKRRLLYVSDINLAYGALKEGNIRRAEDLLKAHTPMPGERELRGFEWFALERLCRGDQQYTFPAQRYSVHCIAISPDGKLLATGSRNTEGEVSDLNGRKVPLAGELKVFDLQTRRELNSLSNPSAGIAAITFSRDQLLAAGNSDGSITLWDAREQRAAGTLAGHTNAVGALSFSPDGQWLASGDLDGTFRLWNMASKREEKTTNLGFQIWTIAFAPDGERIALAGSDGSSVRVLDARTLSLATFPFGKGWMAGLAFSPDGQALAVVCHDGVVRTVDSSNAKATRPREPTTLGKHSALGTSVAFFPDGQTLVSASMDHTIKLWDISGRKEIAVLKGHRGPVWQVAVSPDGGMIASASGDKTVRLWTNSFALEADVLPNPDWVVSVDFSANGKWIATETADGMVSIWDAASKEIVHSFRQGPGEVAGWIALFSTDSTRLISTDPNSINIWDAVNWQEKPLAFGTNSDAHMFCFAQSPDGRVLVSADGTWDGSVLGIMRFWDLSNGKEQTNFVAHPTGIRAVAISPNGRLFATGMRDGEIKLWDFKTRQLVRHLKKVHSGQVSALAFSPDGKLLASGGTDSQFYVWDVVAPETPAKQIEVTGDVISLVFSRDGKTLVETSDSAARLINVATCKELPTFHDHEGFVWAAAFSPDGRVLATGGSDKTVRLWPAARCLEP